MLVLAEGSRVRLRLTIFSHAATGARHMHAFLNYRCNSLIYGNLLCTIGHNQYCVLCNYIDVIIMCIYMYYFVLSFLSAPQQATECLKKHTLDIKLENQRLRSELQQIIEETNDLQLQKKRLDKQYRTLLREHQFNQDLQRLRGSVFSGLHSNTSHSKPESDINFTHHD